MTYQDWAKEHNIDSDECELAWNAAIFQAKLECVKRKDGCIPRNHTEIRDAIEDLES